MKAEIDAKRKAVESKLNREGQLTPEEEAIVSAVHGVFEMYDKDKNGALTDGEYQPFFINWNQLVVGMEADLANDEAIIDETVQSALALAPGGLQYYTNLTKIEVYYLIEKNQDKGAAEKATKVADVVAVEQVKAQASGKHETNAAEGSKIDDGLNFPHTVNDGSEEALNALVDKIFKKYDAKGTGKLFLTDAIPFIKQFSKEEMEMASVGKDFIEDTYAEIDEDSKGFIEKEDMFKYLQGTWDLKQ